MKYHSRSASPKYNSNRHGCCSDNAPYDIKLKRREKICKCTTYIESTLNRLTGQQGTA